MRRRWMMMAAALALTACSARSSVWVPEPEPAKMKTFCGNFGIVIQVGAINCNEVDNLLAHVDRQPGFMFAITGPDYRKLQPGVFEISDDALPPALDPWVTGYWWTGAGINGTMLTGGTLEITTYVAGASATGSYDVQWPDGEASGIFSAEACPACL